MATPGKLSSTEPRGYFDGDGEEQQVKAPSKCGTCGESVMFADSEESNHDDYHEFVFDFESNFFEEAHPPPEDPDEHVFGEGGGQGALSFKAFVKVSDNPPVRFENSDEEDLRDSEDEGNLESKRIRKRWWRWSRWMRWKAAMARLCKQDDSDNDESDSDEEGHQYGEWDDDYQGDDENEESSEDEGIERGRTRFRTPKQTTRLRR